MKKSVSFALIVLLVLSLAGCKSSDYKQAVSAMDQGQYSQAAVTLEALGDYKDSIELLHKCNYALAEQSFESGDYAGAKLAFQALADYKDSANYIKKCDYNLAVDAYEEENYQQALEIFQTLAGYSDADRYLAQCESAILSAKLEGEWESDPLDMTESFLAGVAMVDEEMAQLMDSQGMKFEMTVSVTFGEAGFCTQSGAIVDSERLMQTVTSMIRGYMLASIEASLQENNYTLQDLYDEMGTEDLDEICMELFDCTIQDLVEVIGIREYLQTMVDSLSMECTYVIKDGAIYCNSDVFHYEEQTDTLVTEADEETAELTGIARVTLHRK